MVDADDAIDRAEALNDLGRHAQAVQQLGPVFAAAPDHPGALCAMARAQLGLDEHAHALQAAARAAALVTHMAWPALLASWAASGLDLDQEAANWAKEAVRRQPESSLCHQRVAYTMLAIGEFGIAQSAAAHSLHLGPHRPDAFVVCGVVAHEFNQHARAEAYYKQALALDPEHSPAHQGLARLSMAADRFVDGRNLAKAAERLATAVRVDPTSSDTRGLLDVVLHRFLSRAAYFLALGVFVALLFLPEDGSGPTQFLPILLLTVPAFFVYRFLSSLPPNLRSHLSGMVTSRRIGPAVALLVAALALLGVAMATPQHIRMPSLGGALLLAVTARVQMEAEFRRVQRRLDPGGKPVVPTWLLWVFFLLVIGVTASGVLSITEEPGDLQRYPVLVAFAFLIGWLALTVWARHAGEPPRWWRRISATDLVPGAVAGALTCLVLVSVIAAVVGGRAVTAG